MQEARRAGFVLLAQLRLTQRAGLGEPAPSFHSQISVGRCRNIVLAAPGPALSRDFSFAAVQLFCWDWLCSLAQGRCPNLRTLSKSILFAAHGGARGGGEGRCRSVTQAKPKPTSHASPALPCSSLCWANPIAVLKQLRHLLCFQFSTFHIWADYGGRHHPHSNVFLCKALLFVCVCVCWGVHHSFTKSQDLMF